KIQILDASAYFDCVHSLVAIFKNVNIHCKKLTLKLISMINNNKNRISINEIAEQIKQVVKEVAETETKHKGLERLFPPIVYEQLPDSIKQIVDCFDTPYEKSIALLSDVAMTAMAMPEYVVDYSRKLYS